MIKLKRIILKNYCGYRDYTLDLIDKEGKIKKWLILYGPNGSFKSSFLNVVDLLACPFRIQSRPDPTILLKKMTYNEDYTRGMGEINNNLTNMYIEGIFDDDGEEKKVVIENRWHEIKKEQVLPSGEIEIVEVKEWDVKNSGVVHNDFPSGSGNGAFYCNADSPISTHNFQLHAEYNEDFLKFASDVYGLKCSYPKKCIVVDKGLKYINDFIIHKCGNDKVHYCRFSDGEKKIATLITQLFNHSFRHNGDEKTLFLIDNIEQHLYYLRHMALIENIDKYFPENQIIATTHSPIIIDQMPKENLLSMEQFYYKRRGFPETTL